MKRQIVALLFLILLFTACSFQEETTSENNKSLAEEKQTFENQRYVTSFEGIEAAHDDAGFYATFSVKKQYATDSIDPEHVHVYFPDYIEDEWGNEYENKGQVEKQWLENEKGIVIRQFFQHSLADEAEQLHIPVVLQSTEHERTVQFENMNKEEVPISKDGLTITSLDHDHHRIEIKATDLFDVTGMKWKLVHQDSKVYPQFTRTIREDGKHFHAELEFAIDIPPSFSLEAQRFDTEPLQWKQSFVVPITKRP